MLLRITNMIRDAIKLDITMFASCKIKRRKDREVIEISAEKGTNAPYYIYTRA